MMGLARRPDWLNKKINLKGCEELKRLFKGLGLNTVCQEAHCPNIGECFSQRVATFLILGNVCTRTCNFCAVKGGQPKRPDPQEPQKVALAVEKLGLKHVVITSVTRDDLVDHGSGMFAKTIAAIRKNNKDIRIEVLVPDFQAQDEAIETVLNASPDIFAHNVETVPFLYHKLRPQADFQRSLTVLKKAKQINPDILIKSGLMLGVGEKKNDVLDVITELSKIDCDFLSIGQYLSPGKDHFPVVEYITPDDFNFYKIRAENLGFKHVESAPYVRSSYMACEYISD